MSLIINPYAFRSAVNLAIPSVYWTDSDTGADQGCYYSTDGTTYAAITPTLPVNGIGDNATDGAGLWVACPPSSASLNEIYVSDNPLVGWDTYSLSFRPSGVCYDGSNFVICGAGGNIAYTSNPRGSWTSWSSGVSTQLNEVKYGGGKYVVVGDAGYLRVATSLGGSLISRFSGAAFALTCVKYEPVNDQWLAGGTGGSIRFSTGANAAGTNWTADTSGSVQINSIDMTGSMAVYVASGGRCGYTATPQTAGSWTENGPFGGTANMWCVKYSPLLGLWIALGVNVLRTATTPSGSWTNRMPGGTSGAQNARKGLIVTG
ncbi:hypothetical protein [Chelatococcus sp.]|uniref:hypothetical protein n=1 Tax=Chelatococcus sp. TaxID=1953771 RepID=UPI001ECB4AE0|nr:hypothetical protein [Chelatococcus sp.]MBX3543235.1 hypothetical protein [Chelatococcus sp.]